MADEEQKTKYINLKVTLFGFKPVLKYGTLFSPWVLLYL